MRKIEKTVKIEGKPDIVIRTARINDIRRIQVLYTEVYGGSYSISLVTDMEKAKHAIESDDYYWIVAEISGRIIGSLVYILDLSYRISKAFGAVVSKEYRRLNLAYLMMKLVLDDITVNRKIVDTIYATTRTTTPAPQKLTESLGFVKLGIFPNTHKVHENETHCLTAYFVKEALEKRKKKPVLIPEVFPFYNLVRQQMGIEKPVIQDFTPTQKHIQQKVHLLNFETITAPNFIKNRYKRTKNSGFFQHTYMPFHEPNLIFITPDMSTEIYLHYNTKDKYSVVVGGKTKNNMTLVLESIANKLNQMNMAYIEVIIDAYTPQLQRQAINAKFIPSGYYPAMKRVRNQRLDCVLFSRTFEVLDFGNVRLISVYKDFLREYLKLWRKLYVESVFESTQKIQNIEYK